MMGTPSGGMRHTILEWLKDPSAHFPAGRRRAPADTGVTARAVAAKLGVPRRTALCPPGLPHPPRPVAHPPDPLPHLLPARRDPHRRGGPDVRKRLVTETAARAAGRGRRVPDGGGTAHGPSHGTRAAPLRRPGRPRPRGRRRRSARACADRSGGRPRPPRPPPRRPAHGPHGGAGRHRRPAPRAGTPLPDGDLLVCDAERGLLRVGTQDGTVRVLVDTVAGEPLRFCSNAVALPDGTVYFTVSSRRYPLGEWIADIVEHTGTGRLLRLAPEGGEPDVVLDGLQFANGLAPQCRRLLPGDRRERLPPPHPLRAHRPPRRTRRTLRRPARHAGQPLARGPRRAGLGRPGRTPRPSAGPAAPHPRRPSAAPRPGPRCTRRTARAAPSAWSPSTTRAGPCTTSPAGAPASAWSRACAPSATTWCWAASGSRAWRSAPGPPSAEAAVRWSRP